MANGTGTSGVTADTKSAETIVDHAEKSGLSDKIAPLHRRDDPRHLRANSEAIRHAFETGEFPYHRACLKSSISSIWSRYRSSS